MRQRRLFVRSQDDQMHGAARDGDEGRRQAPAAITMMRTLRPARVAEVLLLAVLVNSVVAPQAPGDAQAAAAQVGGSLSAWGGTPMASWATARPPTATRRCRSAA